MANTLAVQKASSQNPLDNSIRIRTRAVIDTYVAGGVDLSTLLTTALAPYKIDAAKVTDGFANVVNDAQGLLHVADFDPTTRELTLKKCDGTTLVEASNGAITAVTVDVTVFID